MDRLDKIMFGGMGLIVAVSLVLLGFVITHKLNQEPCRPGYIDVRGACVQGYYRERFFH